MVKDGKYGLDCVKYVNFPFKSAVHLAFGVCKKLNKMGNLSKKLKM